MTSMTALRQHRNRFSWKWGWISFCFLIVYHLLPMTLLQYFRLGPGMTLAPGEKTGMLILILGGMALIAGVTGYLSRGRVLETALASTVYIIFLSRMVPSTGMLNEKYEEIGPLVFLLLVFVAGALSTYVGAVLYARVQAKKEEEEVLEEEKELIIDEI